MLDAQFAGSFVAGRELNSPVFDADFTLLATFT